MPVYVDTSAWIALHEPKDQNHARAVAHLRRILDGNEALVTGWHTLVELADGFARHYTQKEAAAELGRLRSSPRIRVVPSEAHMDTALGIFGARPNWGVDLSDCLSFSLMKALGVERAFTYDRDFEKAGFRIEG